MKNCIYCRSEVPIDVPREHVIPQNFGIFKPDLTLLCVCSTCNGYFGSKLEWPMLIESIEGARRLQFGFEGKIGGIGTKGVTPVVGEGADWKGARTRIYTNRNGKEKTEVLPQVGARRDPSEPFEWVLEKDLSVEFAKRYPKGSEFRIVGGKTKADNERLVEKLKVVCPTFVYGGDMNPPFSDDGTVMLQVEYQLSRTAARCLCKIAFNYMALTCGEVFALSSEFNDLREFIRNDVGDAVGRVFVKQKAIIAQEIISGQRGVDDHLLTIEGRPQDSTLTVQLALFNTIPYRIPMTNRYLGHPYLKGHNFSNETKEVHELEGMYAGPDFDSTQIKWPQPDERNGRSNMPVLNAAPVSDALKSEIARSIEMHTFIVKNVPDSFTGDTDEKMLVGAYFSLILEHHGAILHLLDTGQFDGSALALVRPLIDAAYRAHWVYSSASPENIAKLRNGEKCDPGLINMAEAVEKNIDSGGFFLTITPHINALHGYTHGGLEQLGRRFDAAGDIKPTYSDGEKTEAIRATTAHLAALAIAWCQIASGDNTVDNANAKAISDEYRRLYPIPDARDNVSASDADGLK